MSGATWPTYRNTFPKGRVLEFTAADVERRYQDKDGLNVQAVLEIPTLFAVESQHREPARLGRLSRVQLNRNEYQLDYVLDPQVAPIPVEVLEAMAPQLEIGNFEFSRVHWAIKQTDLFEVLLKAGNARAPQPKVFSLDEVRRDDRLVAAMMPFDPRFDPVQQALRETVQAAGMTFQRADNIWEHDHVVQDVVTLISRAAVVICDLSGRNANVFYEMGIAHTLGREVILITQSAADIPFDVVHIRNIRYRPDAKGLVGLQTELACRLETLQKRA